MALGLAVCVGPFGGQTLDEFMIFWRTKVGSKATVNARSAVGDFSSAGKRIAGDCGAVSQYSDGAEGCGINANRGEAAGERGGPAGLAAPRMDGFLRYRRTIADLDAADPTLPRQLPGK